MPNTTYSGTATGGQQVAAPVKLTKAQHEFVLRHKPGELLSRWNQHKTYDFVGRVRDTGVLEIEDGPRSGWPYSWEGTRLTAAGVAYLEAAK